ncbi:beta carbonic anhydrase 1-like [Octopus vulgaris]|uniref:Carbonic anhydrase n=1 Tax=Octopus vulgaris TaxID=6645 RepID=A0AA36FB06_OCTVU|nr:beta carbonic anhydrase 1-like [Octopus vulgaris]
MKGLEKILRGIIKYQLTDKVRMKLSPQNIIEYPTAMSLLFSLKNQCHTHSGTPLQMWLKKYGVASVRKFDQLDSKFVGPLTFQGRFSQLNFQVNIDPENKFPIEDKLSQVNCLQQLQNIATFPILHEKLSKNQIRLHAIWIDVRTGNVSIFSRDEKQFVEITERNYLQLVRECFPVD